MQTTVNADLAKSMRAVQWESITADAESIVASSVKSMRGVTNIADVIAREYGPTLSSASALSRMVNDANKENERLLRSLVNVGAVGQEAARSIPGINEAMRTAFEVPAIEAYREIMDGTITQFGSLTSESMQALFESFDVAGSVARNARAIARIAELQEQSGADSEVDEDVSDEIEEVLNDPQMRDLMSRIFGAVLTYLSMLSWATDQSMSTLMADKKVLRVLGAVATGAAYFAAAETFPALGPQVSTGAILLGALVDLSLTAVAERSDDDMAEEE